MYQEWDGERDGKGGEWKADKILSLSLLLLALALELGKFATVSDYRQTELRTVEMNWHFYWQTDFGVMLRNSNWH